MAKCRRSARQIPLHHNRGVEPPAFHFYYGGMRISPCLGLLVLPISPPLCAEPIPPAIEAMLEAAADDPATLRTIATVAKRTNPDAAQEIDLRVRDLDKARAAAREAQLADQGVLEGWAGQGEAGGFTSSGNTNVTGVSLGVTLNKETRKAVHKLRGQFDWQRDSGVTTRERVLAGYEGNFNINPRLYALTTLSFERDRFSGINTRYAGSLGFGYRVSLGPQFRLAVEAGPALRQTNFTNGNQQGSIAARGGLNSRWVINQNLSFTEEASVYIDSFNTSFTSLTALTARLNTALSARASFQVNTEANPPAGRKNADTTSRATIVYSF
jgi:putative salt-induced outer membrane protein